MNTPAPTPPPAVRGAHWPWTVVARIVFTAIPPLTVGILAWVSLLRVAIVSRRRRDWVWFGVVAVWSTGAFVLTGYNEDDNDWQSNVGLALLILVAIFAAVYYLVSDLRAARAPRYPAHPPLGVPAGRVDRARAELDELSAYLRERNTP
jgi:drug/metabolite transporter (DMT)-like permease